MLYVQLQLSLKYRIEVPENPAKSVPKVNDRTFESRQHYWAAWSHELWLCLNIDMVSQVLIYKPK